MTEALNKPKEKEEEARILPHDYYVGVRVMRDQKPKRFED
jgi:hypothetical protein